MSGGTTFPSEYCPGGHVKRGTSHTVTPVYVLTVRLMITRLHVACTDQCDIAASYYKMMAVEVFLNFACVCSFMIQQTGK